jgi:hypothetical protein
MKKSLVLTLKLSIVFGLFYACAESPKDVAIVNKKVVERETVRNAFWTSDSLRTPEQKAIVQQAESLFYENTVFGNGRMELAIDRSDMEKKGWSMLSVLYYDIVKEDLESTNRYLETASFAQREEIVRGFAKLQEEYLARKDSLHAE